MPPISYTDKVTNDGATAAGKFSAADANEVKSVVNANETAQAAHIASTSNPHGTTKAQVGLGNVDNTADTAKPVSTAQATADAAVLTSANGYTDAKVEGLQAKQPVDVATTGNITLSGTQTIDGIAVTAGMRVLVKNQTTASENGIYLVASGAWTRSSDMNAAGEFPSAYIPVSQGTVNGDTQWKCTNDTVVVGTTAVVIVAVSVSGVELTSNKGAANGYAPLGSNLRVPKANSYILTTPSPVNSAVAASDDPQTVAEKLQGQITANLALAGIPLQTETALFVSRLVAAGSLIDGALINAVDAFFVDGKNNGWLAIMKFIWVPIGNTLNGALVNLYQVSGVPASNTNNNFVSADYTQLDGFGTGATTNTNKYLGCGFNPSDLGLTVENIMVGAILSSELGVGSTKPLFGVNPTSGGAAALYGQNLTSGVAVASGVNAIESAYAGQVCSVTMTGPTSYKTSLNGVTTRNATSSGTNTASDLSTEFRIFRSWFGSDQFGNGKLGGVWLGSGATINQLNTFGKAMRALQIAIGRIKVSGGTTLYTGDSITRAVAASNHKTGWPYLLSQLMGTKELNVGKDGAQLRADIATTGQFNGITSLNTKYPELVNIDANIQTFLWGTNDMRNDGNTSGDTTIIADLKAKYLLAVQSALDSQKKVIIITLPPSTGVSKAKTDLYNAAIVDVAAQKNCTLVDFGNCLWDEGDGTLPTAYYNADNIHPNDLGNLALAEQAYGVIQGRLTRDAYFDFPSIIAGASSDLTVTIYGARARMNCTVPVLTTPNADIILTANVTSNDTVTVTARNISSGAIDLTRQRIKVTVFADKIN